MSGVVKEDTANVTGGQEPEDGLEPEEVAAAELPSDPVTELAGSVHELAEQLRAHHARAKVLERVTDLLHQARTLPVHLDREQAASPLESFALSAELTLERCAVAPKDAQSTMRRAERERACASSKPSAASRQVPPMTAGQHTKLRRLCLHLRHGRT